MVRLAALLVLVLAAAAPARADDEKKPEAAKPDAKPADTTLADTKPADEKPYTEGWRGGSPPGEHFSIRADLWTLGQQRTALELGHLERFKAITTGDLGQPASGAAGGLGAELYTGKTGWLSVDWWAHQARGSTVLARDLSLDETTFARGTTVLSEVTQHIVKLRDGLDIRYRLPIAAETWVDFNFGPVWSLLVRYESIDVHDRTGSPRASDALLGVTVCPGWRAGVDFHALDGFTIRIGSDGDLLPHLAHNWMSFTRAPSIDAWADVSAYVAVRFLFVEVSGGWRYFRSLASGGHFRQAASEMRGAFFELAARF